MWRAAAFAEGVWRQIAVISIDGQPFSSQALLPRAQEMAREHTDYTRLVRYLTQEVQTPNGERNAIELWAPSAMQESNEFDWASPFKIDALEESIALSPRGTGLDAQPYTLAWHDRTAVIIPFTGKEDRIIVEYTPQLRDEHRIERLRQRYATTDYSLETVMDWRGYFGRNSAVVDHWTTMRRNGRSLVASIAGTTGFCAGSVLRRLTRRQPTLERDPTMAPRLTRMLEHYPHIEHTCPDLAVSSSVTGQCATVFVHGTVSCGVQGLKDLIPPPPAAPPPWPVYRFEHDTFLSINENATELADLIQQRIATQHLLIAAHSRGGLVARTAAARLANAYQGQIEIYTFGTPHQGTPLAAMGGKLLNLLFKLGEEFAGAIPILAPVTKAYGYLCDAPTLPPGIEAMREDSGALGMLNTIGDRYPVSSWGSTFDMEKGPSGFGVALEGVLAGALRDRTHDLVVPTASALGAGAQQPLLGCSHVHYFTQQPVRDAILHFCAPPRVGAAQVAKHIMIGGVRAGQEVVPRVRVRPTRRRHKT
jgi:hypothetical protein